MSGLTRVLPRIGQYALVIWIAATLNFALPHVAGGDPVDYRYAGDAQGLSPAQLDQIRASYGLDRSIPEQYVAFWADLARGDLGISVQFNRPVIDVLLDHLPWTLALVGIGTALAALIGVPLGAWAAWRRGSRLDRATVTGVLALDAMPGFWIGMMLIAVFSVHLGWFPSFGATAITAQGLGWYAEAASRLVLPVVTITVAMMGGFFLLSRASTVAVLDEAYVRLARSKGISERRVGLRHGLRTSLLPVYTNLTMAFGAVLSGAVVVETVFAYPGLGQLIYGAVIVRDYPLLQGAFLLITLGIVAVNLLADLTYPLLDPRVRRARSLVERAAP